MIVVCDNCGCSEEDPNSEWGVWWHEVEKPLDYETIADVEVICGKQAATYCRACVRGFIKLGSFEFTAYSGILTITASSKDVGTLNAACIHCKRSIASGDKYWDATAFVFRRGADPTQIVAESLAAIVICDLCAESIDIRNVRSASKW